MIRTFEKRRKYFFSTRIRKAIAFRYLSLFHVYFVFNELCFISRRIDFPVKENYYFIDRREEEEHEMKWPSDGATKSFRVCRSTSKNVIVRVTYLST